MTPQTQSNWKSGFLFLVPPVEQENVKQHNTLTEAQQLQRIISENDWAFLIKYDYNHNATKKVALLLGWDYNDTTGVSDYAVIADGYTAAMIRASKFMQAKTGVSDFLKWADHLKI